MLRTFIIKSSLFNIDKDAKVLSISANDLNANSIRINGDPGMFVKSDKTGKHHKMMPVGLQGTTLIANLEGLSGWSAHITH